MREAYVVTVRPFARGSRLEELSYFSFSKLETGQLVSVSVRKQKIPGVVVAVAPLSDRKAALRTADFTLKKTGLTTSPRFLSKPLMQALEAEAQHIFATTGAVAASVLSQPILTFLSDSELTIPPSLPKQPALEIKPFARSYSFSKRLAYYEAALGKSTRGLLLVPTEKELTVWQALLAERGVAAHVLSGRVGKRVLKALLEAAEGVVISTGSALTLPWHWDTVLIERPESASYLRLERPHVSLVRIATNLGLSLGAEIALLDPLLSIETAATYATPPRRQPKANKPIKVHDRALDAKTFTAVSQKFIPMIERALKRDERVLFLVTRKGLFPETVCRDCGHKAVCSNCGKAVVLHSQPARALRCHHCGLVAAEKELLACTHCGSWRLLSYGIGLDGVLEEVKKQFPDTPTARLETTKDTLPEEARLIVSTEAGLTTVLLSGAPVRIALAVSLDGFFAIPHYRSEWRVRSLLERLRELSDSVAVQTRFVDSEIWNETESALYRRLTAEREKLALPPFGRFLLFKATVGFSRKEAAVRELAELLPEVIWLPAEKRSTKNQITLRAFISEKKISPDLALRLKALPPQWDLECEPRSL